MGYIECFYIFSFSCLRRNAHPQVQMILSQVHMPISSCQQILKLVSPYRAEIGIRDRLKICCQQWHVGSSPTTGTTKVALKTFILSGLGAK